MGLDEAILARLPPEARAALEVADGVLVWKDELAHEPFLRKHLDFLRRIDEGEQQHADIQETQS